MERRVVGDRKFLVPLLCRLVGEGEREKGGR